MPWIEHSDNSEKDEGMDKKTPEQMAEEYAKTEGQPWGCERHFLAGYQAGYESLREEIHALTSQLRQANGMVMKLEAER